MKDGNSYELGALGMEMERDTEIEGEKGREVIM
jgi:hypothetical protein